MRLNLTLECKPASALPWDLSNSHVASLRQAAERTSTGHRPKSNSASCYSDIWEINLLPTDIIYILPAKKIHTYNYEDIIFSLVVFFPSPSALSQCLSLFKCFLRLQWQEEVALGTKQEPALPCCSQQQLSTVPCQIRRKLLSAQSAGGSETPLATAARGACGRYSREAADAHHKTYIYELQCFSNMLAKTSPFPVQLVVITLMSNQLLLICLAS